MSDPSTGNATETAGVGTAVTAMREVTVTLSPEQVQAVVHRATAFTALAQLFAVALDDPKAQTAFLTPLLEDNAYSQTVLRALMILARFPADGTERELTTVAGEVGLSPSTAYRYLHTWTAAGLLERDPVSRRYRRPPLATPSTTTD
jgi:DNA-binding phage protein